jgi:hypothetical protein
VARRDGPLPHAGSGVPVKGRLLQAAILGVSCLIFCAVDQLFLGGIAFMLGIVELAEAIALCRARRP